MQTKPQLETFTKADRQKLMTENDRLKRLIMNFTIQMNQLVVKNRILQNQNRQLETENALLKRKMKVE